MAITQTVTAHFAAETLGRFRAFYQLIGSARDGRLCASFLARAVQLRRFLQEQSVTEKL
jgi:hypothetical protein